MVELRIKEILKEQGKTLNKLSQEMNVSQGSLSLMIRGNMTLPTLERIAKVLEVEPYELFISKVDFEAERQRRLIRLSIPHATVFCPCCGQEICVCQS